MRGLSSWMRMAAVPLAVTMLISTPSRAEDEDLSPSAAVLGRLDGTPVKALEVYRHSRRHALSLGYGIYPMNAYYTGFELSAGYSLFLSRNIYWEVIRANYVLTSDRDTTLELAENYNVSPSEVERLSMMYSTSGGWVLAYGKMLFLDEYLQYFRASLIGGVSQVFTTKTSATGVTVGAKIDFYANDTVSWALEARDTFVFAEGGDEYLSFGLGLGVNL